MLKVLLVDAGALVSRVRQALEAIGSVTDCSFESPAAFSRRLEEHAPDLILMNGATLASVLVETEKLKSDLADRKAIERAKGILMKQRGCSEEEAFRALRTLAMQRGLKLGEVAQQVVDVSSLLG